VRREKYSVHYKFILTQHRDPYGTRLTIRIAPDASVVPQSIAGSGLVSSLKVQATEWAHMSSPGSHDLALQQGNARTGSLSAEYIHACACS